LYVAISGNYVSNSSAVVRRARFLRFATAISPSASQSSTYLSTPVIVTLDGQWQVRITRDPHDAFDENTVTIPVTMH
jgi:hypothetical protein